jgi:flagellar motor switch protein FliN/FliY
LEPPEEPELTFDEEGDEGLSLGDEELELAEPVEQQDLAAEEGEEMISLEVGDLDGDGGEDVFEAAPDVDLEEIDLEGIQLASAGEEAFLEEDAAPAGEEAPEEDFVAVPDVDLDQELDDLEPPDLGMPDPFRQSPGMATESFAAATGAEEWDEGGEESFAVVPDVDLEDEDVVELNLDDLEQATSAAPSPRAPAVTPTAAGGAVSRPAGVEREVLMTIPRKINVEMGSVSLNGREIMELTHGSVVQLNQVVGDPVELVLEGHSIAQGEIVLINGKNLGVRIVSLNK